MDAPRTALLVTPTIHPIHRLVRELKGYDVEERPLDVLSSVAGRNHILNGKGTETIADDDGPIPLVSTSRTHEGSTPPSFPRLRQKAESAHTPTLLDGQVGPGKLEDCHCGREEVDVGKGGRGERVVKDDEKKANSEEGDPERGDDFPKKGRAFRLESVWQGVNASITVETVHNNVVITHLRVQIDNSTKEPPQTRMRRATPGM